MICVFPANATDFSTNGLGALTPTSCTVNETMNGEWELSLVHPIDENGKWSRLQYGNIIKAPVPAASTPRVKLVAQEDGAVIYRVSTQTDPLNLRAGPSTDAARIGSYRKDTEVMLANRTNSEWFEVFCGDGKRGYMSAQYLTYVRTETREAFETGAIIEARQLREQPFRIYRVVPSLTEVQVYARHIFYDLMDNMIVSYTPTAGVAGSNVVNGVFSHCQSPHSFTVYTDLSGTTDEIAFENVNPVEALLGEGGVTEKFKGELARDWYDVYLVKRVGSDSDVHIRQGKNLLGISYDVDETDVVTRILPTGTDADGNTLYLPELHIDSVNISAYPHPKWYHLTVSEAKEVAEGDDYKSLTECYADMRKAAQALLDNGCDLPTITLDVDFINVGDTVEYAQYKPLTDIFMGDSVRVVVDKLGLEVTLRMTQYTYDCMLRRYTKVTLGTASEGIESSLISARQIASGSITGMKLAMNSVGSGQLQSASVGSLQVKTAAIGAAHIQQAAIQTAHIGDASITRAKIAEALVDTLTVNALTAVTAKIKELAAGSITADELYTSIAAIATAQITTANIVSANIQWADIGTLAVATAQIAQAQITTANISEANIDWAAITTLTAAFTAIANASIGTADIDWAHIKDLATDTAIITQGVGGKLYIADLAVTEANMVSLTVGELIVKGADGGFYAVSVDGEGNITSTRKQVGNADVGDASINAGEKLIEGTVTAACLNVNDIFANNAIIKSLIAANIDVDALFARQATIAALNAADITGNEYLRLMVAGKADTEDMEALGERVSAAELKITDEAIVSTVTGSEEYQQAQQQIQDDMDELRGSLGGSELVIGTQTGSTGAWTGVAGFTELVQGQEITYWLPYGTNSVVSLTLTLNGGTTTAAIPCYYGGMQRLTSQYGAGSVIHFTYLENVKIGTQTIAKGWWADANYNVDTYDRIRFANPIRAKTAINASRLVVGDDDGYFNLAASIPFDVTKPILWSTGMIPVNASSSNSYLAYPYCSLTGTLTGFTGIANQTCYLVGTLNGSLFTPRTQFLTTTIPDGEDEYIYIALGTMYNTTQIYLYPEHPMYRFEGGEFKALGQIAYEARAEIETLHAELTTAIEQTDAAIALKADKTVTDDLGNRLETAEASITTQAGQISAVVSQSQSTTNSLNAMTIGGRNYVRNSNNTVELNNTGDTFTSVWMNPVPIMSDDFITDCKGKTICISYYAMCEDLERATSGSWIGMQITYNTETAGTSVHNVMTVTTSLNSGTKPWSRYRIFTTIPATAVSVRATMLTIQNCKGIVRLRNPQVECGSRITDYRPAPEDLELRMNSAESSITQQANQIALKVNTSTYNIDKVYRSTTAPTGTLYGSMLWLDMSLTPNILKRWTGTAWVAIGAQELKTSGITIGSNNVAITTEQFLLQLLDPDNNENVLMEMSAAGNVGFKELYADNVVSDSVVNAYTGPAMLYVNPSYGASSTTIFRSLRDALATLNGKYLRYNVTVTFQTPIAETIFEPSCIEIYGVTGPYRLQITGQSRNKTIAGYFTVKSCTAQVQFHYLNIREGRGLINGTNKNSYLIECNYSSYVSFRNCVMDCNNTTSRGIQGVGSYLDIRNTEFYNVYIAVGMECCTGMMNACKGVADWSIYAVASLAMLSGTVPTGSRSAAMNGQIYAAGVTTDSGTAVIPVSPSETTRQYATLTASWKGSWRTDTLDVVQGLYSDTGYNSSLYWNRGCMWFGGLQNVLEYGAVTIESATLTLHRKTGSGSFNPRSVYLCAITNTTNTGTPSIAVNYGVIGLIGRNETLSVNIPLALVQGLANGTYGGICLYEPSYNFGSANWSDNYIRISGTDDSYNKPSLLVQYSGSTAHG